MVAGSEKTKCCVNKKTGKFGCCYNPDLECCGDDGTCKPKLKANVGNPRLAPAEEVDLTISGEIGIGTISVVKVMNATLDIPDFEPGTAGPVTVTARKVDPTQRAGFWLKVSPPASCSCSKCDLIVDPVMAQLQIPPGARRVRQSFADIPAAEHFVTIRNGAPGMRRVTVIVNDRRVASLSLRRREIRMLDVASEMMESRNVITVVAEGPPYADALFLVADVPGSEGGPNASVALSRVDWEPAPWVPDQDLSWGW